MKTLFFAISMIICMCGISQSEYPKYSIDNNKQVVIFTIEQAQEIDNNLELLELLQKLNNKYLDYDSLNLKVINELGDVIALQKLEITTLKESNTFRDNIINVLKKEIELYITNTQLLKAQVSNRQEVIEYKDKKLKQYKTYMIGGSIVSGTIITSLIYLLLSGKK